MKGKKVEQNILFEIVSVLGKKIRTHKNYWRKIRTDKHPELKFGLEDVKSTIIDTDAVYQSQHLKTVYLYCKRFKNYSIIAVVKHLDGNGFLVTSYQTTKKIKPRKKVWPK